MLGSRDQNECKCRFKLNYQQVYWNSRLGMEHQRVVDALAKTDVVCMCTSRITIVQQACERVPDMMPIDRRHVLRHWTIRVAGCQEGLLGVRQ